MSKELKACPFCGGEGILTNSVVTKPSVHCFNGDCILHEQFFSAKAWNTRPSPWISVEIEPEDYCEYIVRIADDLGNSKVTTEEYYKSEWMLNLGSWWKVTHYQPLPPPSEES